jgi:hypothetical protein
VRRALALAPASGIFRVADLTLLDYLPAAADDTARASAPSGWIGSMRPAGNGAGLSRRRPHRGP